MRELVTNRLPNQDDLFESEKQENYEQLRNRGIGPEEASRMVEVSASDAELIRFGHSLQNRGFSHRKVVGLMLKQHDKMVANKRITDPPELEDGSTEIDWLENSCFEKDPNPCGDCPDDDGRSQLLAVSQQGYSVIENEALGPNYRVPGQKSPIVYHPKKKKVQTRQGQLSQDDMLEEE